MKILQKLTLTVLLALAPLCLFAQTPSSDPYVAEMNKMLQATNSKALMIQTIAISWKNLNLPLTDYETAATAVVDDLWPDLIQLYADEYKKFYSLDDMKAINEFYTTPTGKKFARHSAEMSAIIQQKINSNYTSRIQQVLMQYIRQ
ncbi:MAG: DUF2059 domain-containing protein [Paramuribaculum sp.]|nr:DUF2059 domain-containing protein [Paramuribaculum sp.]